ncbi:MAG: hypothetical protein ACRDVK_00870 [Acidimicrobiia bacterium]
MDLDEIVGLRLGPGPWREVDGPSLERFWKALDRPARSAEVPLFYLVSLLPASTAGLSLPILSPRATINLGLNSLAGAEPVLIGDRVRAIATVSAADWLGVPEESSLQIVRSAVLENQRSEVVLIAETMGRLVY